MTASFSKTIRQAGLVLGFAMSFAALASTASFALTPSPEAKQMCTGDAIRLCSSDIPNLAAITACMKRKKDQLSSACRTVLERDQAALKSRKVMAQ